MRDPARIGNQTLGCVDALYEMFFSDAAGDEISERDVKNFITSYLTGHTTANSLFSTEDVEQIGNKLAKLTKLEPIIQSCPAKSRITWCRFGFLAQRHQVALTEGFITKFGKWRFSLSLTGDVYTVRRKTIGLKVSLPVKFYVSKRVYKGDTMDHFFHGNDEVQLFADNIEWRLCLVIQKPIDIIVPVKTDTSPKRSVKDTVGANAYEAISELVSIAAEGKDFGEILNKKVDGRFQSTVSRKKLTALLMNDFEEQINISGSTLYRALSDFVCSPRSQRKITR